LRGEKLGKWRAHSHATRAKRCACLPPELSENKQLLKHLPDWTVKRC
jgi:hypothetical protein